MKMQSAERVKEEFQDLGRLHVTFIQEQMKSSSARLKVGIPLLFLGLSLSIFGIVRLFDGLAIRLVDAGSGAAQFLSGGLLLVVSLILLVVAAGSLKQIKHYAKEVFREIREDIQWMKSLL
ncbi:MAG TPA: phage holin family protein [Oligoflexus sp.]|uniref:phage holin family protein n=1 Tax=Oligoflexus sp. TaxID=1971216 RepID=UPI002D697F62|nr:phage holin family protein [Oligoflexus sp.]HYX31801.1 phage holin family protein [Oligoflexus sp.]